MADGCIWCDLDGRPGCPVHYRRDSRLIGGVVLVLAVLVVLVVFGAVR